MVEIINSDSASDSVSVAVNSKPRSSDIKPVVVESFPWIYGNQSLVEY